MKIAVAGTGYVGLSIATLLAQHNEVVAVDVIPEKVDLINTKKSPIQDDYIEQYLAEKTLELFARDIEAAGQLHEYYHPETGAPIMNPGFQNWNLLALNMQAWLNHEEVVEEF